MANKEHLEILGRGVAAWNEWRGEDVDLKIVPDLSSAELSGTNLFSANLGGANLSGANLSRSFLISANLFGANLGGANLNSTDLSGANFIGADLRGVDLRGAHLFSTNFSNAELTGANVTEAFAMNTFFANIDLREIPGLDSIDHVGPSEISISTIYRSEGKIPEVFLRGCGVPESFIVQIPALVSAMQPIQFYSCFISYSSKDQKFAERLHADLQNKGVRCWYAPEDLKIGEKIRIGIDESIRVHDKLLLILSKNSIENEWVEKEVETAMERERQLKRTILFPIRLNDTVLKVQSGWAADIQRTRNIGDFRRWKSHDTYSKAFERLLRDLKASA